MAFTYNPATAAGQLRLLISDTVDDGHVFEDDEIAAFLSMAGDSLHRAASRALRAIAINRALLAKRIKVLDIEVDTKGAATELLAMAKALDDADDDGAFAIAEWVPGGFAFEERLEKESQRYR